MKELRKKIIQVFRKFSMDPHHSPLKNQKDREIAGRFVDYVHSTSYDTSSLPYYVPNGLAKHVNKAECVFAMMCQIILDYWCLVQCKESPDSCKTVIDNGLKKLEAVYETYDQLKVLGDAKGYCLLKSLRKDLYGQKEEQPKGEKSGPEETNEGTDQPDDSKEAQVTIESHVRDMAQDHVESLKAVVESCEDCSGSGLKADKFTGVQQDDPCETCAGEGTAVEDDDGGDISLGEEQALRDGGAL